MKIISECCELAKSRHINRSSPFVLRQCMLSIVQVIGKLIRDMAGAAGICWSLIWLLLLLVGGWPIGSLCAGFYLLLSPFGACIEALTPLINLLEQGLKLPLTCALNLVHQKPLC